MKNELLDKGIILPSGEINKDKINLVAGAITQPFAEMVWVTTGGDMETVNRLTDILVTMNTPADREKLFKILKMLYGLMGLPFAEEAEPMGADPAVWNTSFFPLRLTLAKSYRTLSQTKQNKTRTSGVSYSLRGNRNAAVFLPSCYAVGAKKALIYRACRTQNRRSKGKIPFPSKSMFYRVTNPQQRS